MFKDPGHVKVLDKRIGAITSLPWERIRECLALISVPGVPSAPVSFCDSPISLVRPLRTFTREGGNPWRRCGAKGGLVPYFLVSVLASVVRQGGDVHCTALRPACRSRCPFQKRIRDSASARTANQRLSGQAQSVPQTTVLGTISLD
jgi:hypothetical protein